MATIKVDGKSYFVIESLPYCQAGMPAKFVSTDSGERVAVKRGGKWEWWTARDRLGLRGQVVGMSGEQ